MVEQHRNTPCSGRESCFVSIPRVIVTLFISKDLTNLGQLIRIQSLRSQPALSFLVFKGTNYYTDFGGRLPNIFTLLQNVSV